MADHSKPTTSSTYSNVLPELDSRLDDLALQLDSGTTSPTNLPVGAKRWNSATSKWEKWNGSAWSDMAVTYSISVSGSAGTLTGYAPSVSATASTVPVRNASAEVVGNITGNAHTVDGYHANTGTTASTVPVRDANGKLPGDITGTAADSTLLAGKTAEQVAALGSSPAIRQTVLRGRINEYTGLPNFLDEGTGLQATLSASSSDPIVISFSAGFDTSGAIEKFAVIENNANIDLYASGKNYIYADRNSSTGAITYGATMTKPHYGHNPPGVRLGVAENGTVMSSFGDGKTGFTVRTSAAVDGGFFQTAAASAATASTVTQAAIGQDWGAGIKKLIVGYELCGTSDQGFINGANPSISTYLQGSDDNVTWNYIPTQSGGNSATATITDVGSGVLKNPALRCSTPYRYHRVLIQNWGSAAIMYVSEVYFYEIKVDYHWFDFETYLMKRWSGTAWEAKQRVFIGEATCNATSISADSAITYALQGRATSLIITAASSTDYTFTHNVGGNQDLHKIIVKVRANDTYCWATALRTYISSAYYGLSPVALTHLSAKAANPSGYVGHGTVFGTESGPASNWSAGEIMISVDRGW